jgi:hypothetical protein
MLHLKATSNWGRDILYGSLVKGCYCKRLELFALAAECVTALAVPNISGLGAYNWSPSCRQIKNQNFPGSCTIMHYMQENNGRTLRLTDGTYCTHIKRWRKDFLEMLLLAQLSKTFSHFMTPNVQYRLHNSPPQGHVLNYLHPTSSRTR